MKVNRFASFLIAIIYAFCATVAPAFADSEFGNGLDGSDGAWGWRPPGGSGFGMSDGIAGGDMYGDAYGGFSGGPFGAAGSGGGEMFRNLSFLIALFALFKGSNTQSSAGMAIANLTNAPMSGQTMPRQGRGHISTRPQGGDSSEAGNGDPAPSAKQPTSQNTPVTEVVVDDRSEQSDEPRDADNSIDEKTSDKSASHKANDGIDVI